MKRERERERERESERESEGERERERLVLEPLKSRVQNGRGIGAKLLGPLQGFVKYIHLTGKHSINETEWLFHVNYAIKSAMENFLNIKLS